MPEGGQVKTPKRIPSGWKLPVGLMLVTLSLKERCAPHETPGGALPAQDTTQSIAKRVVSTAILAVGGWLIFAGVRCFGGRLRNSSLT